MNIFVTDHCPIQSDSQPTRQAHSQDATRDLPDAVNHIQRLGITASANYTSQTAHPIVQHMVHFASHPCTQWAAANQYNLAWLIQHGLALCDEYTARYDKVHTCQDVIYQAEAIYHKCFGGDTTDAATYVRDFTRAMPEYIKYNDRISTIEAYKYYLNTKPWLAHNYLRIPSRKPSFIKTTMTTSLPVYDFSDDSKIAKALNDAPAVKAIKEKQFKDALVKETQVAQAKGLVPAKKATKKSGKAGRIVGISKDENEYIQQVLQMIADDSELGSSNPNYAKIQARYNK